jgi:hypothetical protein
MTIEVLWSIEAPLVTGRKVTASKIGKALTPAKTDASQSHNWHSVFQSAKEVLVSSFEILDIQMCAGWISRSLTVQHKTGREGGERKKKEKKTPAFLPSYWHVLKLTERTSYIIL